MTHRFVLTVVLTAIAGPALAQAARPAAQAPQPVTRATFMQRIDSAFVASDSNKDGFTDRAEIEAAETKLLAARKATLLREREAAFRRMDTDKNGSLSAQEFSAPLASAALPKANAAPILDRLDTNKDGKVSLAENRVPAMAQFDRVDANKDGTVTAEERRAQGRR